MLPSVVDAEDSSMMRSRVLQLGICTTSPRTSRAYSTILSHRMGKCSPKSRSLSQSSSASPGSPLMLVCTAFESKGDKCRARVPNGWNRWCDAHYRKCCQGTGAYKALEKEAARMKERGMELHCTRREWDARIQQMEVDALYIRMNVHLRFFSHGEKVTGHARAVSIRETALDVARFTVSYYSDERPLPSVPEASTDPFDVEEPGLDQRISPDSAVASTSIAEYQDSHSSDSDGWSLSAGVDDVETRSYPASDSDRTETQLGFESSSRAAKPVADPHGEDSTDCDLRSPCVGLDDDDTHLAAASDASLNITLNTNILPDSLSEPVATTSDEPPVTGPYISGPQEEIPPIYLKFVKSEDAPFSVMRNLPIGDYLVSTEIRTTSHLDVAPEEMPILITCWAKNEKRGLMVVSTWEGTLLESAYHVENLEPASLGGDREEELHPP